MTIVLIRHAESVPSADVPEPDWPLSARGYHQARALVADVPAGIERIVSSPFLRTRATVEPLAADRGLAIEVDGRLAERSSGGVWLDDFAAQMRRAFADPDYALPGAESMRRALARFAPAIDEIRALGVATAIASHGTVLSLYLGLGYAQWAAMPMPYVHVLQR